MAQWCEAMRNTPTKPTHIETYTLEAIRARANLRTQTCTARTTTIRLGACFGLAHCDTLPVVPPYLTAKQSRHLNARQKLRIPSWHLSIMLGDHDVCKTGTLSAHYSDSEDL